MKLPLRSALFALLGLAFAEAAAQTAVLVAPLPQGFATAQILYVTRQVLLGRKWTVLSEDERSLIAENDGSSLRIIVDSDAVRYVDRSRPPRGGGAAGRRNRREPREELLSAVPQAELDGLRADLAAAMAAGPSAIPGTAPIAGKPAVPTGQVLVAKLPNVDPVRAGDAVRLALASRGWKLLPEEDGAVVAHQRNGDADAKVKIFLADGALRFIDQSTRRDGASKAQVPERWIGYLRADIEKALASLPAAKAADPVEERLRRLKSLLDSGTITPQEYDQKRAEILKGL